MGPLESHDDPWGWSGRHGPSEIDMDQLLTAEMTRLQATLGYAWTSKALLRQALTHSSYGNAHGESHNERLEFLGDSVLDLVSAQYLMARYPSSREGFMSQRRAEVVQKGTLARHARRLGVWSAILLNAKDEYLRNVDSVLADAFEAVVGALYQDCGDLNLVQARLQSCGVLD